MAIRYATKTGSWSDPTVWDSGTLPTSSDIVYANNFTVTINQDIDVEELATQSASGITQGGGFLISGNRTINLITLGAKTYWGSNNVLLRTANVGSDTITINVGTLACDSNGSTNGRYVIRLINGFTGIVNLNIDDVNCPGGNQYADVISMDATATLNINVTNGVVTYGSNWLRITAGTVNLSVGSYIKHSAGNAVRVIYQTAGICNITCPLIYAEGALTDGCVVSIQGGTVLFNEVEIRGATGNTVVNLSSCVKITAGVVTFRDCTFRPGNSPTYGALAVLCGNGGIVRYSGDVYTGGFVANTGPFGFLPLMSIITVDSGGNGLRFHIPDDNNFPTDNVGSETVLTAHGDNLPLEEDVRLGVEYGADDHLVGTLVVPAPFTLSDVATVTGTQLEAALSS